MICIEKLNDDDLVVLNPSWLGSTLIGSLFSFDQLKLYEPNGRFCSDILHKLHPGLKPDKLVSLLEMLELCTKCKEDAKDEIEFPCLCTISDVSDMYTMFKQNRSDYVHGGVRIVAPRGLANQLIHVFPKVQVRLRQHRRLASTNRDAISLYSFQHCSLYIQGNLRVLVMMTADSQAIDVRSCGPCGERLALYYFKEEVTDIVYSVLNDCCPGLRLEHHLLSCVELKSTFGMVHAYCPKDIHEAQMCSNVTVLLPGKDRINEQICDLVGFGSTEIFSQLVSGTRLHIAHLTLEARRGLSQVVDPPDATGRDWCLLAVSLGLAGELPKLEEAESPTDACIRLWSRNQDATASVLIEKLRGLGRQDAVDALFSCLPLFVRSSDINCVEPNGGCASEISDHTPSSITSR